MPDPVRLFAPTTPGDARESRPGLAPAREAIFFMPQPPPSQQNPDPAHAQVQLLHLFQSLLQFQQREIRLPSHLLLHPLPDRACHSASRPVPPGSNLDLPALAPTRRQLLGPTLTDPKPRRQLFQTYFPAVIDFEELSPQIVRVRLWHLVERTIAASQIALLASPCIVTIKML